MTGELYYLIWFFQGVPNLKMTKLSVVAGHRDFGKAKQVKFIQVYDK